MTSSKAVQGQTHPHLDIHVPHDVLVYEITGPMFFGAAENAVGALRGIGDNVRAVIFVLDDVPMMDVSGLVALESTLKRLSSMGKRVYLVGLAEQPRELLLKARVLGDKSAVKDFAALGDALHDLSGS